MRRTTLNRLRETGLALTIKDIALRVMTERKLSVSDARLVRLMEKKAGSCPRSLRSRGVVQSEKERGSCLRWKLVEAEVAMSRPHSTDLRERALLACEADEDDFTAVARGFRVGVSALRLWRRQAREGRRAPLGMGRGPAPLGGRLDVLNDA